MPDIFVIDDASPEDLAMIQALYARSSTTARDHRRRVEEVGSGKFNQNYVVNYNHKSIADCGSTTIFSEGVSMLAAKAIQDWPLYSGQETSTRALNMADCQLVDPVGTAESSAILARWMAFYMSSVGPVEDHVRRTYPRREDESATIYDRAVMARVFDILRGFLPAGLKTQVSWHTNLRQAGDHLSWMRFHPLVEVRELAEKALILIVEQKQATRKMDLPEEVEQYYLPMGYQVNCQVTWGLPAALYVMELRSSKTIHPTLRHVVHNMIREFREEFVGIPVHADMDPDDWSVRRGQQTIEKKS